MTSYDICLQIVSRCIIFICALPMLIVGSALLVTANLRVIDKTVDESYYWTEARPAVVYLAISLVAALVSIAISLNRTN